MPPPAPSPQKQRFRVDERVLARSDGGMYEAVIKKARFRLPPAAAAKGGEGEGGDGGATAPVAAWQYQVHYLGWNSRYDRWTDGDEDLLPATAENVKEARRVQAEAAEREKQRRARQRAEREGRKRAAGGEARGGAGGPPRPAAGRKRARPAASPKSSPPLTAQEATELLGAAASLPFTLRTILVNDKEEVTRRGYYVATGYDAVGSVSNWTPPRGVHALPSQVPVAAVLGGFRRERRREARARARKAAARLGGRGALDEAAVGDLRRRTERDGARWGEFADGLRDVFDGALGPFLLYREERAQHRAATLDPDLLGTEGGKLPSEVYGAEFLLRLFVRLPLLLERSPVLESALLRQDRRELIGFAEGIAALIVFLQKNVAACFRAMYREPLEGEWTPEEAELTRRCAVAAGAEDGQGEDGDYETTVS